MVSYPCHRMAAYVLQNRDFPRAGDRIGAAMLTADRRFVTAVAPTEHGETVMTLADYVATQ